MSDEVHEILSRTSEGFRRILGMSENITDVLRKSERFGEEGRGLVMIIDDVRGD